MPIARLYSAQPHVLRGHIITIEIDISKNSLHAFTVVGLPDKAVDEARDRVSAALKNSGFTSPKSQNQKIVVSLSPADLKKEGAYFDLSIALAYLLSLGEMEFDPEGKLFLGELSLDGQLRAIKGTLPLVEEARRRGFTEVYVPVGNAREAALVRGITVYGVKNLKEIIAHLSPPPAQNESENSLPLFQMTPIPETEIIYPVRDNDINFSDIRGQEGAKRGLEIAAAGGHNAAMSGPPGTGKTMLARVFRDLLPELSREHMLEITGIHSIAGALSGDIITLPPFRSPHHSSSYVSMIGGGTYPRPGEVTLAHRGVLFLDEFPEFEKRVIESLRQPLEDNVVTISRARGTALFPSNFILIAAMNPCPCGNLGNRGRPCICKPSDLARYARKISGPIMDRIDIWLTVSNVEYNKLGDDVPSGETTEIIRARVIHARELQRERFRDSGRIGTVNADMTVKDLSRYVSLSDDVKKILTDSAARLNLSARAYHRVIKLARTIADLADSSDILDVHILEALQYRPKN